MVNKEIYIPKIIKLREKESNIEKKELLKDIPEIQREWIEKSTEQETKINQLLSNIDRYFSYLYGHDENERSSTSCKEGVLMKTIKDPMRRNSPFSLNVKDFLEHASMLIMTYYEELFNQYTEYINNQNWLLKSSLQLNMELKDMINKLKKDIDNSKSPEGRWEDDFRIKMNNKIKERINESNIAKIVGFWKQGIEQGIDDSLVKQRKKEIIDEEFKELKILETTKSEIDDKSEDKAET